ncbi:restriction endonuclease subunit S [Mycoplasmopsis lipophila]|uniref:restriction endonuclease subunit S n=1 Tax=Mycoplasmopsis lipophila TaxID=2117 RepID=UPI0038733022
MFDKKFKNVKKDKQKEIVNFKHISAKQLKMYQNIKDGEVKLLSTGNYDGFTNYVKNDKNINYGEIISIPTGGSPIIKYWNGYFIDSLNILMVSKNINLYNLKFIFYSLMNIKTKIEEHYIGSSIKHPNMKNILDIQIPIPSLEVQQKIVNILDKLENYSKDIKTGLPLEIEQRQKQYEYYKNKLLTFDKEK